MTEPSSDTGDDSGALYEHEPARRIPRWVKLVGIVVAVLILLVVIMVLFSPGGGEGGGHGPGRHGLAAAECGWSC